MSENTAAERGLREYPILFSGPMVRSIMQGTKHVTRRLSKRWLKVKAGDRLWVRETWASPEADKTKQGRVAYNADGVCGCWCGHGEDRMFMCHGRILEAEGYRQCFPESGSSTFGLGKYSDIRSGEYPSYRYGWRPSIHMPRWASRILLECEEDARLEGLHEITEEEARLEGVEPSERVGLHCAYRAAFQDLWCMLHTKPGETWADNPEVVRVGRFRCLQSPTKWE